MCIEHELEAFGGVAVFPTLPSLFPLFIQCDGCLFPFPASGFMAGLPGSWLLTVEAPGCLKHPTST